MGYLAKSKDTDEYKEIDPTTFTAEMFEELQLFHCSEILEENFEEEIKRFQIIEIQRQQQLLNKKLTELMGAVSSPIPPSVVEAPPVVLPDGTVSTAVSTPKNVNKLPLNINPKTGTQYQPQEVDDLYAKFVEDIQQQSDKVIFCENNKDHFVAIVTTKDSNFPKTVNGIPLVQITEEEHLNM